MKAILASALFVFAACGGSPLDPGAGDSPGSGTQTLNVNGSAHATPSVASASKSADFDTDFSVQLTLNNAAVTTGTVTMKSTHGTVMLTFNQDNGGRWEGTAGGYDEVYQLDVVSGSDKISGVRVDGPDIHVITAPAPGASIDTTMPLMLKWSRETAADAAALNGGDQGIDGLTITDTGNYSMAPNFLRADKLAARTDTIRLTRTNRIEPAGAVAGSNFEVSISNEIDVVALANPNAP
jgi:hypothetical protein